MSESPRDVESPPLTERVLVDWDGELRYRGRRGSGPSIVLDGSKVAGPGAVDTVAIALAVCSAQDVLLILRKRRTPAEALQVEVSFARAEGTPRRITDMHVLFRARTRSSRQQVQRAASLAVQKYCSVASSLNPDICITTDAEVEEP